VYLTLFLKINCIVAVSVFLLWKPFLDKHECINPYYRAYGNSYAGIDRIRTDMKQIINEKGLQEYKRVFTDGSLIGNKVGCAK
jgi:hypothetical protein